MLRNLREITQALSKPSYFLESEFFLGFKPYPKQREIFDAFYKGNFRELVLVAGMRSGKSVLSSAFAMYETFLLLIRKSPQTDFGLHPSSNIFILLVATSDEQAKDTLFSHIEYWTRNSPFFQQYNPKILSNQIVFKQKRIVIFSGSSSSASMVGRTAKAVCFDELARFEQTEGKRGAWMVYTSLSRATMTFGKDGHRFITSSPVHPDDVLMQLYERGKTIDDVLALKYPTWEFNPNITFESLETERMRDPIAFWRDYGCEPISTMYPYFNMNFIDDKFESRPNLLRILYETGNLNISLESSRYVLGLDPAVTRDAFGIALMHKDEDRYVLDGVLDLVPSEREVSAIKVREFIEKLLKYFPIDTVATDIHMYPELLEYLRSRGIRVIVKHVRRDTYDSFREKLYLGKVNLLFDERLRDEMRNLQSIGNKVDHPRGGSKDLIDAVVQAFRALDEPRPSYKFNLVEVIKRS